MDEDGVQMVPVPLSEDLLYVLIALDKDGNRIHYEVPAGGQFVLVEMDAGLDERLERLIAELGRLRWGYQPGRVIQLALLGGIDGAA